MLCIHRFISTSGQQQHKNTKKITVCGVEFVVFNVNKKYNPIVPLKPYKIKWAARRNDLQ